MKKIARLPFAVAATVRALRDFPRMNSAVVGDAIVEWRDRDHIVFFHRGSGAERRPASLRGVVGLPTRVTVVSSVQ